MRNFTVSNIVTLDGFFAGQGGNPMVLDMDAAFDAMNLERMHAASTVVLGRASFEPPDTPIPSGQPHRHSHAGLN
ncbi:hypothetical protein [Micromonospora sp. KC721]|uniref:hypothetical protein n=1 Tax=Micromonospora sp. KC721 TaxID=2530380 RepID=UPI00104C3E4E|nr:hypothetical protein [Micromonospora sp. KC721]TDB80405.1 hypothetical protein E1182_08965 [Micromonospora sp. KC721]